MKRFLFFTLFLCVSTLSFPQEKRDWESYLINYGEMSDIESSSWESSFDLLYNLEDNPININTATREDLEQLPFLTPQNIEDISEYVYLHGPIRSMGELALIKSIDYNQRQLLNVFAYAGEPRKPGYPKLENIMKYGKSNLMATGKIPFYMRNGDKNGYMGYQYKHSIMYDFTYGDYIRAGFLGSQDAGEPFFAEVNSTGYDFYSFYLVLKKLGRIKTLALGRYRLKFGMGLVVNNNYSFGKLSALTTMQAQSSNIRAHASRSDAKYMQGAAATLRISKHIDANLFVSYRNFDATLNDDGTISTIVTSGYHRTKTEIEKKNNSSNFTSGGNISYKIGGCHIGITALLTKLNRELKPKLTEIYRKHYAAGKDFINGSIDYGYTGHRLYFNGETATGKGCGIATINMLKYSLTDQIDITALQRYYSYRYNSPYSNSFSDGGKVQNETGAYIGLRWNPSPSFNLLAYSDCAYFEWPKYQVTGSSYSLDNFVQATWALGQMVFTANYGVKLRQKDNDNKTSLVFRQKHRSRFSTTYVTNHWQSKTQADFSLSKYEGNSLGWMVSENLSYTLPGKFFVNISTAYFHTDDYNSRVYVYERGLMRTFNVPSFFGHGMRCALLASTDIIHNLRILGKIGTVKYFDRNYIGSSYQQIDGSSATDLELQVSWKF